MRSEWMLALLAGWGFCGVFVVLYVKTIRKNLKLFLAIKAERREFQTTLRKQQGMTFKFTKRNGRFVHTFCEGTLASKLGVFADYVVGKSLEDFIPDKDYVAHKELYYDRAWQGEEVSYEGRLNGVWYLSSLRPVYHHGKVTEVIASCVDITQQKYTEHVLRQNEQMYRLIAESSTDLIRILEPDMTIRYASPSHVQVLGYRPEELIGIRCVNLVAPEERQRTAEAFLDMIQRKELHYQITFPALHKDGTSILFETHGRPVVDENGDITSVVVVSRNVTARVKSEEEYRKNDKLALAGQLAAGIAHEIRNPMTAIKGFVQLLRTPSDKQAYYTEIVMSEMTRVESIVNEFLMLAKPQATQYRRNDLHTLLLDVATLLNSQAILQNVQIHFRRPPEGLGVMAVESQLKQVFINVIKNSIESMPDGGNVYMDVDQREEFVVVRILDQGFGIPQERMPRLGEPFYTTKEKGTGLGLMVSYKIVRDHGGDILIESTVGHGTQVEILLPICTESALHYEPEMVASKRLL